MAVDAHASTWEKEREPGIHAGNAKEVCESGLRETRFSATRLWREIERVREANWQCHTVNAHARLRRKAVLAARSLPMFPGRRVLELGAGSGVWTEHLAVVLAGLNCITAAVFNEDLRRKAQSRKLPNTQFIHAEDLESTFPPGNFDYIVATDVLTDDLAPSGLEIVSRCLKPGGQFVFFGPNISNPLAYFRKGLRFLFSQSQDDRGHRPINSDNWSHAALRHGFKSVEATPLEVISPCRSTVGQAVNLILERAPIASAFSNAVILSGVKPGGERSEDTPAVDLAVHRQLFGAVSVVIPCHNEEANIRRLVKTLLGMYGPYIHEIVIVDDNSTDRTAEVTAALASSEPRIRLVRRKPPGGVGRALRNGYAAATGRYILTIDCDFVTIAPEFKGLFDAVAEGCDGAIGSRFSSDSALVRYPFPKFLCNRGYHLVLNLLLSKRVRDVSNNLKLYRAEIFKNLEIKQNHFAANVETGLKPLLLNYRIREVPVSWINRTEGMGCSSFNLLKVGASYLDVLLRTAWRFWRGQYSNQY